MDSNYKPYGIDRSSWDSAYLCNKCGGLLYYHMQTKQGHCLNYRCQDYPEGVELYSRDDEDLKTVNNQIANRQEALGQIVKTCDYNSLALLLLERRRRLVQRFFSSGIMQVPSFLHSNEILSFIQQYKSLGIKKDPLTFRAVIRLHNELMKLVDYLEDIKEGRCLLARKPTDNVVYRMKYYDVIANEIWASYGLVNLPPSVNASRYRYHEAIQKVLGNLGMIVGTEYAPYFERLWPLAESMKYLFKRNYRASRTYQYSVTTTDLANILSIVASLKDDNLTTVPLLNLLKHLIAQPVRDKAFTRFVGLLSGENDTIPVLFRMGGNVVLDRRTLLLFFIYMFSQHLASTSHVSGPQRIVQLKQAVSDEYVNSLKAKLEASGYSCMWAPTLIGRYDYDVIAFSETSREILLIEAKFRDPSPSSLSDRTLIQQELTYPRYGLLPEVMRQQRRYDFFISEPDLFQSRLRLKDKTQRYNVEVYFVTKHTPLMNRYKDVRVMSEKDFIDTKLPNVV